MSTGSLPTTLVRFCVADLQVGISGSQRGDGNMLPLPTLARNKEGTETCDFG